MSKKPIIVFEGIEGSGKSYHISNVSRYLKKKKIDPKDYSATKTRRLGKRVGFLKTKCESSSHGGKFLPLTISGRRVGICLWLWDHGCARGCPWHGRHAVWVPKTLSGRGEWFHLQASERKTPNGWLLLGEVSIFPVWSYSNGVRFVSNVVIPFFPFQKSNVKTPNHQACRQSRHRVLCLLQWAEEEGQDGLIQTESNHPVLTIQHLPHTIGYLNSLQVKSPLSDTTG